MKAFSLAFSRLYSLLGGPLMEGQPPEFLRGVAGLSDALPEDLSFLGNFKYAPAVKSSRAGVILVPIGFKELPNPGQAYLYVPDPSLALAQACKLLQEELFPAPTPGIHPTACVDPSAQIDPTASVGPLCVVQAHAVLGPRVVLEAQVFVGRWAQIGADSFLMPHAVVGAYCVLGERVRLESGAIIGSEGFGYAFQNGAHQKLPQVGNVVLEDDVEIGANSTLDRARLGQTRVGRGTKVDNLVQIAHNVVIGPHTLVVAQAGIAGSTVVEEHCVIGGQAGIAGHLRIGQGSRVGAQSGVNHDLASGEYVRGTPAAPYMVMQRADVLKKRLPDLFKRVAALEAASELASEKAGALNPSATVS